jgi:hypothetical protein
VGTLRKYLPSSHPRGLVDCSTISLHTQVYAALLIIIGGEQSPPEDLCEDLVGELIALIKELWDQDYKYLEPILGVSVSNLDPLIDRCKNSLLTIIAVVMLAVAGRATARRDPES